jgi:hypothetical protein
VPRISHRRGSGGALARAAGSPGVGAGAHGVLLNVTPRLAAWAVAGML